MSKSTVYCRFCVDEPFYLFEQKVYCVSDYKAFVAARGAVLSGGRVAVRSL